MYKDIIKRHRSGCVVCGESLEYFENARELSCQLCGGKFLSDCACKLGHYVCDDCHAAKAYDEITNFALASKSQNPISIATEMMKNIYVNMHGPEHHYLVCAALLCAYKNCGGEGLDISILLKRALERAKNVPGGICGLWGSCGAAIASGIFVSVVTGANSLSVKEWSLANAMTSRSLEVISKNGGPRCCKRNSYLAIDTAIDFAKEHFSVQMEKSSDIKCIFLPLNKQCKGLTCIYFPKKTS